MAPFLFWLRRILEADFISLRPGSLEARGVNASLPQAPSLAALPAHRYGAKVILFLECVRLRTQVVQCSSLITAPPGDSLSADLRGA